jgi:hypothetical protein
MRERWRTIGVGAVIGLVAAGVAIGTAELVAGIVNPAASPILTVGQSAIDATPEWLKSLAIRTFGEKDKTVLLGGIGATLLLAAVALGIACLRHPGWASPGFWPSGRSCGISVDPAVSQPFDAMPASAATVAGVIALPAPGRGRSGGAEVGHQRPRRGATGTWVIDRRRLLFTGVAGVVAAFAAGGTGNLFARRFRADESRAAVTIPTPSSPATAASGSELSVPGLGPFITPNDRFYRVDTALLVPAVMAEDWQLRVRGMVERELTLDYEQLLARPLLERDITLTCVSNPVGGRYAGNARWVGAPLKDLLE